ncbi:MAG: hypothetical protein ACK56J_06370 [Planctomycetota bacterium]|nr:hypothetical protein [Planctomycetaceae bacterium]
MSTPQPDICDHPLIQADDLWLYVSDRLRSATVDLYSAFLVAHEALRIGRNGYLQAAWNYHLSISGLLQIYMHCLTARAFHADAMARVAEEWFLNDIHLLTESRRHFLADRLSDGGALVSNQQFLQSLSEMRTAFDSLPDDDGPYHVEVFPWHYAAPERELLAPGSQPEFRRTDAVDSEVEDLIMKLCCGKWP